MSEFLKNIKQQVSHLKQETVVLVQALSDRRTPFPAKFFAAVAVAYLLSPIDLIPDFIPVLGLLDDLVLVPLLIKITISLIPKDLLEEIRAKTVSGERLQKKWYFAIPVVLLYVGILVWLYFKFFKPEPH